MLKPMIRMAMILLLILLLFSVWEPIIKMLGLLKTVIWPFVIAWMMYYLFQPLTGLLRRRNVPQLWATVIVFFCSATGLAVLIANGLPRLAGQWQAWRKLLPGWSVQAQQFVEQMREQPEWPDAVKRGIEEALLRSEHWVSELVSMTFLNLPETANVFFLLFVIPFLLFYFLKEDGRWKERISSIAPAKFRANVLNWLEELDGSLGDFVRGQLIVCLMIGFAAYVGYRLIGLPNALLLAVFVGVMNVIPYLGPLISMVPAWLAASTVSWQMLITVTVLSVFFQVIEGYVLSPWIVGRAADTHPLLVLFALIAGAEWGGVWGLLIAVPLLIILKTSWKHFRLHQPPV